MSNEPQTRPPSLPSFPLSPDQAAALQQLQEFAQHPKQRVFILRGYAGTGKTTLLRAYIEWLIEADITPYLAAPTGRAAKVLQEKTGYDASTIHRLIYQFDDLDGDLEALSRANTNLQNSSSQQLTLRFDLRPQPEEAQTTRVYLIDEASMLGDSVNQHESAAVFGSGRLLSDLLRFHPGAKYVFIGDDCQLPPVNEQLSPALSREYLTQAHGLKPEEATLTKIFRQADGADLLAVATRLRALVAQPDPDKWAFLPAGDARDLIRYPDAQQLSERYLATWREDQLDRAVMICYTNVQRLHLNRAFLTAKGKTPGALHKGDLLMVLQNHRPTGLVNGDFVLVKDFSAQRTVRAELYFRKVTVLSPHDGQEHQVMLIEDLLNSSRTNLDSHQHKALWIDFYYRMKRKGIMQGSKEFREAAERDAYLNGMRATYGYAVTCHKCQGGEWDEVFLFQDNQIQNQGKPNVYRWWYTALTRARRQVHLPQSWLLR